MNNRIFTIRQNNGLPGVLLAQPAPWTFDREVLVEPRAVNFTGGALGPFVDLQCDWPCGEGAFAQERHAHPAHGDTKWFPGNLRGGRPTVLQGCALGEGTHLKIKESKPGLRILICVVISEAGFSIEHI